MNVPKITMPGIIKPRKKAVPMPIRTPKGEPLVRRYNPKFELGIKPKARPRMTGPKKSPTPNNKKPMPGRPLPRRTPKGTPVRRKMM